ncbi:hypothetical protein S7711_07981 [Stachybotrys chartarum IBT 7711]|uniref:FAD dependent oxidoreductase domain-containing protein n=1 Tax=Stachybotrys chartarum (strain CBS 109288 / IBT 7711) TaxID=1280523 RepID=A0A084AFA5_STACB|nr:hypothetical protein S7711_07981 [Stachybotrys chartarum IBT 7711]
METAPGSILIVGAGVFGLSSAWALTKRPFFADTSIVVVDDTRGTFPASDGASVDSSRIIRADYANAAYADLASKAQEEWRKQGDDDLGGQGRYTESGFITSANTFEEVSVGGKTGMEYAKASLDNVLRLMKEKGAQEQPARVFHNKEDIQSYLGVQGDPGDWGYLNYGSGWAHAEEGMKWLYKQVQGTGRVKLIDAHVDQLVTEGKRVVGAALSDGSVLNADVVFAAAGAWTGGLIDLRGQVEATGHILGYLDITDEESKVLRNHPVVLNLSTGLFVIPPRANVLKVARHGYGYLNPTTIAKALPSSPSEQRKPIVASQPLTSRDGAGNTFPVEAEGELRRALRDLVPSMDLENRPWKQTRLCWYSDTRDGDWLVDWHPGWEGLFVACGDSGHGFKFLPVLGEKLVDCLVGQGGELGQMWRWKDVEDERVGREVDGVYRGLITNDGSRGGKPGMILKEEIEKSS